MSANYKQIGKEVLTLLGRVVCLFLLGYVSTLHNCRVLAVSALLHCYAT